MGNRGSVGSFVTIQCVKNWGNFTEKAEGGRAWFITWCFEVAPSLNKLSRLGNYKKGCRRVGCVSVPKTDPKDVSAGSGESC